MIRNHLYAVRQLSSILESFMLDFRVVDLLLRCLKAAISSASVVGTSGTALTIRAEIVGGGGLCRWLGRYNLSRKCRSHRVVVRNTMLSRTSVEWLAQRYWLKASLLQRPLTFIASNGRRRRRYSGVEPIRDSNRMSMRLW